MGNYLWGVALFLLLNAFVVLWRAAQGPTVEDRILAVNVIGTKTAVLLVALALMSSNEMLLDIALVYGLLNFIVSIAATRFIETGRLPGGPQ